MTTVIKSTIDLCEMLVFDTLLGKMRDYSKEMYVCVCKDTTYIVEPCKNGTKFSLSNKFPVKMLQPMKT